MRSASGKNAAASGGLVVGHVRAVRTLLPDWLERGSGRFVSTVSAAGLLTMIGAAPYSVTKHGAVAFAEWLSLTYRHRGLRVHAICPQGVRTDMLTAAGSAGAASSGRSRPGVLYAGCLYAGRVGVNPESPGRASRGRAEAGRRPESGGRASREAGGAQVQGSSSALARLAATVRRATRKARVA